MDEPAGKAAVIWMVGEYGDEITVSAEGGKMSIRWCWCRWWWWWWWWW